MGPALEGKICSGADLTMNSEGIRMFNKYRILLAFPHAFHALRWPPENRLGFY